MNKINNSILREERKNPKTSPSTLLVSQMQNYRLGNINFQIRGREEPRKVQDRPVVWNQPNPGNPKSLALTLIVCMFTRSHSHTSQVVKSNTQSVSLHTLSTLHSAL